MSEDPSPLPQSGAPQPPSPSHTAPQPAGGGTNVVLVVLGVLALVVLLMCGGLAAVAYYAYVNAKQFGADLSRNVIVNVIEQSELQEKDKRAVVAQVDRVADAYKAGRISLEDVGRVMQELAESPLFVTAMVEAAEAKYVAPSGLSDEEKAEARLTLERVARGVYEKTIPPESLDPALDPIATQDAQGNRQLKDRITDAELRDFLARSKQIADQAQVPEGPFQIDIAEEFKKAVDRALAGK
jgi:hypothetical protein